MDENSSNGKKILDIYKNLGLTMFDTNGQLKSGYDLLSELSREWPGLDTNTQKYIATTLAGTNQLNNFLALMNNFEHATETTTTALNSQGSAVQENNRYMENIQAKVSALKSTFQDLSNNVISDDFIKKILDVANGLLKIANTDLGRVVTQVLLFSTATWGLGELVKVSRILPIIVGQFTNLGAIAGAAGAAGGITSMADAAAAASLVLEGSLLPVILGVAVAGVGLIAAFKAIDKATADSRKSFSELGEDIEKNTSKIETNKQRLEEINALPWNEKTTEILSEKDALEKENEELQKQIDKYEKLQQKKAKNAIAGGTISEIRYGVSKDTTGLSSTQLARVTNVNFSSYEELAKYLGTIIPEAAGKTKEELEALGIVFETSEKQVYKVGQSYEDELIARAKELDEALKNNHELTTEQQKDYEEITKKLGDLADAHDILGDSQNNAKDTLDALNATYETYTTLASKAVGQTALTEQQITALTNKYPQLSSAISEVNGLHYLNVEALKSVTGATKEEVAEMYNAVAATVAFNNQAIDGTQKLAVLKQIAAAAGVTQDLLSGFGSSEARYNQSLRRLTNQGMKMEDASNQILSGLWNKWMSSVDFTSKVTSGGSSYIPSSAGTSAKKSSDAAAKSQKKEKTAVELSTEAWKEQLSLLKDKLELLEKSGATDQEQIDQMIAIQKAIHEQADKYRALNLGNESEEVRQLGILWWDYANNIKSLQDKMAEEKEKRDKEAEEAEKERLEKAKARAEELYETEKKLWEERLEKQKSDYETAVNVVLKKIDEEVEKLNKQRDETEKFYDDQIKALQDTNDELDRQIQKEQLLENLAKAKDKTLYVFKDGRFQYLQDTEAIAEAQAQLDAYNREEALRKETENLNKQKENALKAIDAQIEGWNKYREQWEKVTTDYQEQQDKLIAQQVLGIDLEQKNWQTRLTNVQDFVDKYNNILSQLDAGYPKTLKDYYKDQGLNSDGSAWSGSGYDPGTGSGGTLRDDGKVDYKDDSPGKDMDKNQDGKPDSGWLKDQGAPDWVVNSAKQDEKKSSSSRRHANGTLSAEPGLSLVGERGPELRVLGGGEGIIPADITRNLWNWGKINPGAFAQSMNNVFNIDNLSLPSVTNAQDFITGLRQMAYQRAYKRA